MRYELATLDLELHLANRIGTTKIHEGITTFEQRRERARQTIARHRLAERFTSTKKNAITFAEAFRRVYGEPL